MESGERKTEALARPVATADEPDNSLTREDVIQRLGVVLSNPALRRQALEEVIADAREYGTMKGLDDLMCKLFDYYREEFYAQTGQPVDAEFVTRLSYFLRITCRRYMGSYMRHEMYRVAWQMFPRCGTVRLLDRMIECNTQREEDVIGDWNLPFDEAQEKVDQQALKSGYNVVAHFCLDNGMNEVVMRCLEGVGDGEVSPDVEDLVFLLESFCLIPSAFVKLQPSLERVMVLANSHPNVEFRGLCIRTVGNFAGCCDAALQFVLQRQTFLNVFCANCAGLDPRILMDVLSTLGERWKGLMWRARALPIEFLQQVVGALVQCMNHTNSKIQLAALEALSEATVSKEVTAMYMAGGVVDAIFAFLEGDWEFKAKVKAMATLLGVFENSSNDIKAALIDRNLIDVVNEWVESMFNEIPDEFLGFVGWLLELAEINGPDSPWFEKVESLLEADNLLQAISDCGRYDSVPTQFGMNSPEVWAYSTLQQIDDFRQRFGI